MLSSVTPIIAATSFCSNFRASLLFLRCSPKVCGFSMIFDDILVDKSVSKKGNAAVPLWLLQSPGKGMYLFTHHGAAIPQQDQRPPARSYRPPCRSHPRAIQRTHLAEDQREQRRCAHPCHSRARDTGKTI